VNGTTKNSNWPIPFIVGVGRSGTTLLRLMLDAHPELSIPPETHFIPRLSQLDNKASSLREEFIETITQSPTWIDFQIPEKAFREKLKEINPFTVSRGLKCFYQLYANRFKKYRWGDKTPPYNLHMTSIQELFPQAHFIHIIRDGRDVALSLRHLWFGPGEDIREQASDWLSRIHKSQQQAQTLQHYMEIRYEDLVTNPKSVLKKICKFIDISYNVQMQRYHQTAESRLDELGHRYNQDGSIWVNRNQRIFIHKLTAQPPDQSRIERWKIEMSRNERLQFETIAGDLLSEYGYETELIRKEI